MNSIKYPKCPTSRQRLRRVLSLWIGLLLLGTGYAWLASRYGGFPCVFRTLTGLRCPGCGVTHMCLALLHGDLAEAFHANAAVLCMLPALAELLAHQCLRYVRYGSRRLLPWEERLAWCMAGILVIFGVGRNLFF